MLDLYNFFKILEKIFILIDSFFIKLLYVLTGGYRERATPVPIPNTEVKPLIADGTAWGTMWESKTLPVLQL